MQKCESKSMLRIQLFLTVSGWLYLNSSSIRLLSIDKITPVTIQDWNDDSHSHILHALQTLHNYANVQHSFVEKKKSINMSKIKGKLFITYQSYLHSIVVEDSLVKIQNVTYRAFEWKSMLLVPEQWYSTYCIEGAENKLHVNFFSVRLVVMLVDLQH